MSEPRILVVTGGSRGIGEAIVRIEAAKGTKICFSYLDSRSAAVALVEELRQQGAQCCAVQGDVADTAFAAYLFNTAEETLGPVTALVNNAGVTGGIGAFAELSDELLRCTIDVNVVGTMTVAREAVRRWLTKGFKGRMVNISSVAAATGAPGEYVHYAASKAAIEAFTIGLGKEVAQHGIRVNAVAPGTTWTGIHAAGGDAARPIRVAGSIPMRRAADPEEIARSVCWLLSDEASYVTGTVLRVSGGL